MSGAFSTTKAAKRCQIGPEGEDRRGLAVEQPREIGRDVHALALGEVDQDQVDVRVGG